MTRKITPPRLRKLTKMRKSLLFAARLRKLNAQSTNYKPSAQPRNSFLPTTIAVSTSKSKHTRKSGNPSPLSIPLILNLPTY